jgi:hypothetical protein
MRQSKVYRFIATLITFSALGSIFAPQAIASALDVSAANIDAAGWILFVLSELSGPIGRRLKNKPWFGIIDAIVSSYRDKKERAKI